MLKIKEKNDLKNKKVILRTDFDVPIRRFKEIKENAPIIKETFRIEKQKKTIDFLIEKGACILIVAHISATESFEPILPQFEKILDHKINFLTNFDHLEQFGQLGQLNLLDNIRKWSGEKENNSIFARQLAGGFDLYVNNAFAVCHRKHASVLALADFLPAYPGFLIEEETAALEKFISVPNKGKIIIIGGAKAETKIPVIKNFLGKAEKILVGGVIANDILKERGEYVDDSLVDENTKEILSGLDLYDSRIVMPIDFNAPGGKILDIGSKSLNNFKKIAEEAQTIIWNGPMGLFENSDYARGTNELAKALAGFHNYRIIGGGDTISAVNNLGLLDKFDFVSTGGGAMLEFLAGNRLPGLEALHYYE